MKTNWLPDKYVYLPSATDEQIEDIMVDELRDQFEIPPTFHGRPVILKHESGVDTFTRQSRTFDHLMRRGSNGNRILDRFRCIRIKWISAVIRNAMKPEVTIFRERNSNTGNEQFVFFLESERYIVIIEDYGENFCVTSAYYLDDQNKFRSLVNRKNAT